MNTKVVILVDRSAGNEKVGEMWTAPYIFDKTATLEDVIKAIPEYREDIFKDGTRHNIRITIPADQTGKE